MASESYGNTANHGTSPGGARDVSPAIYRWVSLPKKRFGVPEARSNRGTESDSDVFGSTVPPALEVIGAIVPTAEAVGYFRVSLRDERRV